MKKYKDILIIKNKDKIIVKKALENLHKEGYIETIIIKNDKSNLFSEYPNSAFAIRSDSYIDNKTDDCRILGFAIWFYFDENSEIIGKETWD